MHAIKDRKREKAPTPQQIRVPRQTNKQNSLPCLVAQPAQVSGEGWAADKLVAVSKDTHIKQR